jgi:hypothetical protein
MKTELKAAVYLKTFGNKRTAIICINEIIASITYLCNLKDGMNTIEFEYINELKLVIHEINKL